MTDSPARTGTALLVDDDRFFVDMVQMWLRAWRFPTATAHDGESALRLLRTRNDIRVVVLDLDMPGMSGFGFLAERATDPAVRAIPVVVLTGLAVRRERFAAYNVTQVLGKPVAADDLRQAIAGFWPE
jgi:CheY-like chemotaxis protein